MPVRLALTQSKPLFSWLILALNLVIWLLMTFSGGSTRADVLVRFGAKVPWLIAAGQYWRLLTAMFLHIGLVHLLFNSYALYSLGPQVESLFGRGRFLIIYLLSGLAGSVASYALSASLSAGASGAIFGLIAAMAVFVAGHRQMLGRRGSQALTNIVLVILFNLGLSFSVPGIDVWGHLGGLMGGSVVSWLLRPRYRVVFDSQGAPQVLDATSLRSKLLPLALVAAALVAITVLGTLRWRVLTHLPGDLGPQWMALFIRFTVL